MSDRRRRRLEDEGEDETETETAKTSAGPEIDLTTTSSQEGKTKVSECESEGEPGDVAVSECDSESTADDGGEQEETEEGSESETEEGSDTEDASDSGTATESGEEYTDDEGLDGERQSGDGEEQPETDKPDDDEDRKNPAYVPRKGAFYEHDFRDGLEGQEEEGEVEVAPEPLQPKKKLWQDEGKWSHEHYRDDQQAPKTREELIAIYGYDIRAADKPPEVYPRKPKRQGQGPRRENKFQDYLPRMAVIDTTEYGKDTVPNIDEDGLITYDDSPPKDHTHSYNSKRKGRSSNFERNDTDIANVGEINKQYQRRDDKNYPQSFSGRLSEDFPTPQESQRLRPNQDDSGRGRRANQQNNRYRDSPQQDTNRYRESNKRDNTYGETNIQQDSRYRQSKHQQDNRYRESNHQQDNNRYRESNHQQDNRYRESTNHQDSRYRESNQYSKEEDGTNNYSQNNTRRGGHRGGLRGRGGTSNYHSQDVRQQEARMNEDNWNVKDSYDRGRKDGHYNRNENDRRSTAHEDQSSPRTQGPREDSNKNYKSQDRGYNNKRSPYQSGGGSDSVPPRRYGNDDYNNSRRNNYRGYEQPPRHQQQQQQHQNNTELREFTNTSYNMEDKPGGDRSAGSYTEGVGQGEVIDRSNGVLPAKDLPSSNITTSGSQIEKKSYAKERRAKGVQRIGDPVIKDRPSNSSSSMDSQGVSGHPQQYINANPNVSTETSSAPVTIGAKRYSSQRQHGLAKGNYSEPPLPVEHGANLYNPALPPPSFYQRDPTTTGQQPSSSSPAGVPDAPHFNPSILPPGTTALPYHLPAVPQPGLQLAATVARPPAVFQQTRAPPPAAPIPQSVPALIAAPFIPPGMIYRAPAAPPRVPPPGTPAGLALPYAYTAPPPPNPIAAAAPPVAAVSQADQQGLKPGGQQKKVYRGDITYYAPELQHPSRTPQKRPKSAIPIVDPQEMRRLKELDAAREGISLEKEDLATRPVISTISTLAVTSASEVPSSLTFEGSPHPHAEDGPSKSSEYSSAEIPKPQRIQHDRVVKEHCSDGSESARVKEEAGEASIKLETDERITGLKQAGDASSTVSLGEASNFNSSSSLPVAVESMKNEVLDVCRELPVLQEKNSPSAGIKSGESTDVSSATTVIKASGDSIEVIKASVDSIEVIKASVDSIEVIKASGELIEVSQPKDIVLSTDVVVQSKEEPAA